MKTELESVQKNTWKPMFLFIACIILTAFSLGGFLYSSYEPKFILLIITVLAFIQAMFQLFKMQPSHE
ncbi:hypothetical protein GLV94_08755 [Virgibacillus halodenitrificans]|uniref:Uncharacterized protein n=1 Tax=Virgibacillus halodenitrificans TaxID=1482 RepID=A0AAC9IXR0_VIRHA|nr:hypothetical protein [Virgibacillus halodenitrificans]APC47193.1 hypothetical protein BME96_02910 [Virgibacillus halodenitrificans]MBD1223636.1 hypothetical protein [Virgibacillus halodenitrificans]MCG1028014.1 hypothetical protein [Virgibacillus halodenitrificans]MCJ0931919.1 hypothetical protein [Virgibacillus halodenitrificans]MEC2159369.1 hypothetical protein [Virgibacillus halodenitrificans]